MKKILAIILKDTLIRFTSPVEWLFFFILPVVFILLLSGGTGPSADQRIHLEVVDQAQSELSEMLLAELEKSTSVKPVLTTFENAVSDFDSRQASAILIIPKDFSLAMAQKGVIEVELRQQKNNLNALIDQQAVQVGVGRVSSLVDIANASVENAISFGLSESEIDQKKYFNDAFLSAQRTMLEVPELVNVIEGNTVDTINYDPRANSVAGQMITWVFIPLIGLSAMFASERQGGTLRRILVAPTSKALIIGGTVLGQVLTAVIQMIVLLTFGTLIMKINWAESPLALLLIIITSTLSAAALGTMLGTFVKTEGQGNGLSIMIGMVMAMMGGCWYPIELFPEVIRSAAKVLPTTWAMQGFLDIAVRGVGLSGVLLESSILFGFALLFFAIGVWRFRYE
ncbi:MAG: ABC transporter permease [Chloroflexota bacterium]|nr:ABC transporter permease [Chloroflexota bacterium]